MRCDRRPRGPGTRSLRHDRRGPSGGCGSAVAEAAFFWPPGSLVSHVRVGVPRSGISHGTSFSSSSGCSCQVRLCCEGVMASPAVRGVLDLASLLPAGEVVAYSPRWAAPGAFRVSLAVLRRAGTQHRAVRRVAGCPSQWEPGPGGGRGWVRCHPVSTYDLPASQDGGCWRGPGGQPGRVRALSVPARNWRAPGGYRQYASIFQAIRKGASPIYRFCQISM